MKGRPKRYLSIILTLCLLLSLFSAGTSAVLAAEPAAFTVTFVYDENNRDLDVTVGVDATGKVEQPTTPERAGYQFLGWYDQADNAFDFANTAISDDLTLIACWANGSPDDPYQISDMDSLRWMQAAIAGSDGVTYRAKNYVLTADIVYDGAGFSPIPAFSGVLDGRGHTVAGLEINGEGLFAAISGTIKNLGLEDITVNSGSANTGAFAGQASGGFILEHCYATGRVNGRPVTGGGYTGGLVGYSNASGGKINSCYFSGSVEASARAGGIAAYASGTDIENCYSAGNITSASSTTTGIGGVLGDCRANTTVQKCYSTSAVKGNSFVGGIVGAHNAGTVTDCVALNSMVWSTQTDSGGYAGRVCGNKSAGLATASYGWEDMLVIGTAAVNGDHGMPLSIAEINTAAGWPTLFWSGAWSYTEGQLPILNGLSGQDGTIPGWLQPLAAGMNWKVTFFYEDGVTPALVKEAADQGLVQPPDDPLYGDNRFMGWYERGATESFNFEGPITTDVILFANWAAPGTAANPYLIANMDDLRWMSEAVNNNPLSSAYRRAYYELTDDLVYDGKGFNTMNPLVSSGYIFYGNAFQGQLEGAGHTVTGLEIDGQGLFGYISSGAVRNLGLIDVTVNANENHSYVGAIVGYLDDGSAYGVSTGIIENCYVINGNVSGEGNVGGLAGFVSEPACTVKNSYFRGSVAGTDSVGGIAGSSYGIIENVYSAGSVYGETAVGGIAGNIYGNGVLANGYSTSAVSGLTNAGGLVGSLSGDASLATCLALNPYVQAISAEIGRAGRVVGYFDGSGVAIDCYSWEDTMLSAAITDAGENGFALSTAYIKDGSGIPEVFTTAPWAYTVGQLPILIGLGAQEAGFDPGVFTPGDVNSDGVIDFDDVLDALNHYLGTAVLEGDAFLAADVNMDGAIDFDDVLDILNHYLGTNLLNS